MRISELSRSTGVTVATIKYYIREGLLRPGTPVSATQAEYDGSHVDRLRLIRALVDVGRLSITTVRELLTTLDAPTDSPSRRPSDETQAGTGEPDTDPSLADDPEQRVRQAVATAHRALSPRAPADAPVPERALAAIATLGWQIAAGTPALVELESALAALDAVQLSPDEHTLRTYAAAALSVAEQDVTGVPGDSSAAETIRYVVIGTVMYEPVLIALRRLAQQHVFTELGARADR
jgi:DNA-binding transcriptional MerR regulator